MSILVSTEITAIATVVLALFAIVTAVFAVRAFRTESKQLDEQRKINKEQTGVLDLQKQELHASLKEREREAEERRREQATKVVAWFTRQDSHAVAATPRWGAVVRNGSGLPILEVEVSFYAVQPLPGGEWEPILLGRAMGGWRIIAPRQDEFMEISGQFTSKDDDIDKDKYAVSVKFTDAAGNKWERDARSELIART